MLLYLTLLFAICASAVVGMDLLQEGRFSGCFCLQGTLITIHTGYIYEKGSQAKAINSVLCSQDFIKSITINQ